MPTDVAVPVLPPPSVALLESVLSLGSAEPEAHRSAAGLTSADLEAALTTLVQHGLVRVRRTPTGSVRLQPGKPDAVQAFIASGAVVPQQARRLVTSRESLRMVLTATPPSAGVERITDIGLLMEHINTLARQTRQESLSVLAGPPPPEEMLQAALPEDIGMIERGVRVCSVSPVSHLSSAAVRTAAEQLDRAGGVVRFAGATPHRLIVFDRHTALVPIDNHSPQLGALIVTEPLLVRSLRFLATTLLRHGRSTDEVADSAESYEPTAVDLRVLGLMSSGVTDQIAAKDMGVTDRQFRRYVAHVLDKLGATSRFQAGVRAVERGWL